MRNDHKGKIDHGEFATFYAGGSKGPAARADGKGGLLRRGYYRRWHVSRVLVGPFASRTGARAMAFNPAVDSTLD